MSGEVDALAAGLRAVYGGDVMDFVEADPDGYGAARMRQRAEDAAYAKARRKVERRAEKAASAFVGYALKHPEWREELGLGSSGIDGGEQR